MIPDSVQIKKLWDKFNLPPVKRNHSLWVAHLSVWFAREIRKKQKDIIINIPLLKAAALLHDIDKNVPALAGEIHPDTGVRLLKEEGFIEVSDVVKRHSLHAILDTRIAPVTWEEKLLYLADKMVKHTIIGVDERFLLWRSHTLPPRAHKLLDASYPKVKQLEREVCTMIGVKPEDVSLLASQTKIDTMMTTT